jgi:hypothetical protein
VGLSRCKHEPPFDPATCGDAQTIEEMKQWVLFKPGTYWIYEEENTGYIDTVAVTEYFDGLSSGGFAAFGCVMHSSFDGYNYDYYFNDSYSYDCQENDNCRCRRIACSKSKPGDFFGDAYVFIFPLESGRMTGISATTDLFGNCSIVNYPVFFEGLVDTLSNCALFNTPYAVQHEWTQANYLMSTNIGIVKKELIDLNQIWNLIEYEIIQ